MESDSYLAGEVKRSISVFVWGGRRCAAVEESIETLSVALASRPDERRVAVIVCRLPS